VGDSILAIDPGRDKAGFALFDEQGSLVESGIAAVGELRDRVGALVAGRAVKALALGRGTNSAALAAQLLDLDIPVHLVDEYETSREARELYFEDHPPRGWRRLIHLGLQLPPRPIDDYAAILIGRRFLARGRAP
jgi:RNase H-fold protein (predicted Holliday junction resolvase)